MWLGGCVRGRRGFGRRGGRTERGCAFGAMDESGDWLCGRTWIVGSVRLRGGGPEVESNWVGGLGGGWVWGELGVGRCGQ